MESAREDRTPCLDNRNQERNVEKIRENEENKYLPIASHQDWVYMKERERTLPLQIFNF